MNLFNYKLTGSSQGIVDTNNQQPIDSPSPTQSIPSGIPDSMSGWDMASSFAPAIGNHLNATEPTSDMQNDLDPNMTTVNEAEYYGTNLNEVGVIYETNVDSAYSHLGKNVLDSYSTQTQAQLNVLSGSAARAYQFTPTASTTSWKQTSTQDISWNFKGAAGAPTFASSLSRRQIMSIEEAMGSQPMSFKELVMKLVDLEDAPQHERQAKLNEYYEANAEFNRKYIEKLQQVGAANRFMSWMDRFEAWDLGD